MTKGNDKTYTRDDIGHSPDQDKLISVESHLQEMLKQEATYWEHQEPIRLRNLCMASQTAYICRTELSCRLLWGGAVAAAVACVSVVMTLNSQLVDFSGAEQNTAVVHFSRKPFVYNCSDASELYASLPSCPPLQRPPTPVRPEPQGKIGLVNP